MRVKKFCWIPTQIYTKKYWQNGFRWLSFAYLDVDGKMYETKEPIE